MPPPSLQREETDLTVAAGEIIIRYTCKLESGQIDAAEIGGSGEEGGPLRIGNT